MRGVNHQLAAEMPGFATDECKAASTEVIPSDPDSRDAWIIFRLRLVGSSLADIARELGITRQTVRVAIERPYPKVERAIAAKLGLRPETIWPDRYARRDRRERGAA